MQFVFIYCLCRQPPNIWTNLRCCFRTFFSFSANGLGFHHSSGQRLNPFASDCPEKKSRVYFCDSFLAHLIRSCHWNERLQFFFIFNFWYSEQIITIIRIFCKLLKHTFDVNIYRTGENIHKSTEIWSSILWIDQYILRSLLSTSPKYTTMKSVGVRAYFFFVAGSYVNLINVCF